MTSSLPAAQPDAAFQPVSFSSPDGPVRLEVPMPRDLFDRLTDHDEAPRCRYDMATGLAEFVAEPGISHEWRAARLTALFVQIEDALADVGQIASGELLSAAATRLLSAAATRLLSDDGVYEPDASLFVGRAVVEAALQEEGWIDSRAGHPLPALVAEVDRSVKSSGKLAPYFRMGVREAWTWSRRDGARIWVASPESPGGFRAADRSTVLPGLDRERLDRLLAHGSAATTARLARQLARDVAAAIAAQGAGWPAG